VASSINPLDNELRVDRGDDVTLRVPIYDSAGAPLDCTGASFRFTVKASLDDAIGAAVFQLTNPSVNGIDMTDAASGIVVVTMPAAYLEGMAGDYVYDLEMTLAGKKTTVISAARLFVQKDVTTPGVAGSPALVIEEFASISIAVAEYFKDQATGKFWKKVFENGQENTYGPSDTVPF